MQQDLEKYYKLLGLTSGASLQEIKKQYRKLVFIYHPDKNNGDESKFLIIKDAYDILTHKKEPTTPIKTSRSSSSVAEKSKEERVKEAKQRYQEYAYKESVENERYFKNLTSGYKWKVLKLNAIFGTFFAIMLITEIYLPNHYNPMKLTYYSQQVYSGLDKNEVSLIELESGQSFFVSNIDYDLYHNYPSGYVAESWFFHNPITIISDQGIHLKEYKIQFTIGSHPLIFSFLFLIPLFTVIYKRRNILFSFLHQLSFYGISLLMIYFIFTNDRWIHILTLGFL